VAECIGRHERILPEHTKKAPANKIAQQKVIFYSKSNYLHYEFANSIIIIIFAPLSLLLIMVQFIVILFDYE